MAISFSGLASGLDTVSWITSLTALKQAKVTSLQNDRQNIISAQETLFNIKSYFSSFRSKLEKLTDAKFNIANMDVFSKKVAKSSKASAATASVTSSAQEGSYSVTVEKLATNTKVQSTFKTGSITTVKQEATTASTLKDIGISSGEITVIKEDMTGATFTINQNSTMSQLVQQFRDNGIEASFDSANSLFSVKAGVSDIIDTGNTHIVDKLKLTAAGNGYKAENLWDTTTHTEVRIADSNTALNLLGVNAGTFNIYKEGEDTPYQVTLESNDTIGSLISALADEGITATISNDGIFTLNNAYIDAATDQTGIVEAFGLNVPITVDSFSAESSDINCVRVTGATANEDTTFGQFGLDSELVLIVGDLPKWQALGYTDDEIGEMISYVTINSNTTIGQFVSDLQNLGYDAYIDSENSVLETGTFIDLQSGDSNKFNELFDINSLQMGAWQSLTRLDLTSTEPIIISTTYPEGTSPITSAIETTASQVLSYETVIAVSTITTAGISVTGDIITQYGLTTTSRAFTGGTFVAGNGLSTTLGELGITGTQYITMTANGTESVLEFGTSSTLQDIANSINSVSQGYCNIGQKQIITENNKFIRAINQRDTSTMTAFSTVDANAALTSGTYKISTTEELQKLATMVNDGKLADANANSLEFVLANDIDLSGVANWTPIGNYSYSGGQSYGNGFRGTFDGNGHVISNMNITSNPSSAHGYVGLFNNVSYGVIKNLGVEDANISANINMGYKGVLACQLIHSTVTNCYTTGSISNANNYVGGLISQPSNSVIEDCYSTVDITGDNNSFQRGGLIGRNSSGTVEIINSYSSGTNNGGSVNLYGSFVSGATITMTNSSMVDSISDIKDITMRFNNFIGTVNHIDTSTLTAMSTTGNTILMSGTYSISTTEDLQKLANMTNMGWIRSDCVFVLANDIDLSSVCGEGVGNWTPIGLTNANAFTATFDGNGYEISNFYSNDSTGGAAHGLFSHVNGATFRNLGLTDCDLTFTNYHTGALFGYGEGDITVENCYATGSVDGGYATGGLIGSVGYDNSNSSLTMENCWVDLNIKADRQVAGLVGCLGFNCSCSITNSATAGTLQGNGSGDNEVSTLAGGFGRYTTKNNFSSMTVIIEGTGAINTSGYTAVDDIETALFANRGAITGISSELGAVFGINPAPDRSYSLGQTTVAPSATTKLSELGFVDSHAFRLDVANNITTSNTMGDMGYNAGYVRTTQGVAEFSSDTTIGEFVDALNSIGIDAEFGDISYYVMNGDHMDELRDGTYTTTNWGIYFSGDIIEVKSQVTAGGEWTNTLFDGSITTQIGRISVGHDNGNSVNLTFNSDSSIQSIINGLASQGVSASLDANGRLQINSSETDTGFITGINNASLASVLGMTGHTGLNQSYSETMNAFAQNVTLKASDSTTLSILGFSAQNQSITFADGTSIEVNSTMTLGALKSALENKGIHAELTADGKLFFSGAESSKNGFIEDITPVDVNSQDVRALMSIGNNVPITSGTYSISTTEELQMLATITNNGRVGNGAVFVLANDIDMSEVDNWEGIGTSTNAFHGIFEGNGHVIYNLNAESGLFNNVYDATIRNFGIENANINCINNDERGIIANYCSLTSIYNCYTTGSISSNRDAVGGLVGVATNYCSIINCYSTADVSGANAVGGLFGALENYENLHDCRFSGNVTGNSDQAPLVGPLIGFTDNGNIDYYSINCYYANEAVNTGIGGINSYGYYHPINAAAPTIHLSSTNAITSITSDLADFFGLSPEIYNWEGDLYSIRTPEAQYNTITDQTTLGELGLNGSQEILLRDGSYTITIDSTMTITDLSNALNSIGNNSTEIRLENGVATIDDGEGLFAHEYNSPLYDLLGINVNDILKNTKMGDIYNQTPLGDVLQYTHHNYSGSGKSEGKIFFDNDIADLTLGEFSDILKSYGIDVSVNNGAILYKSDYGDSLELNTPIGGLLSTIIETGHTTFRLKYSTPVNDSITNDTLISDLVLNTGTTAGMSYTSDILTVNVESVVTNGHNLSGAGVLGVSQAGREFSTDSFINNRTALHEAANANIALRSGMQTLSSALNDGGIDSVGTYAISTTQDLIALSSIVNEGRDLSKNTFMMTNDIDLKGVDFTPIGSATYKFDGTFNGCGHIIKNLDMEVSSSEIGLFGYNIGRIENLGIENASVKTDSGTGIGILAGVNGGDIFNCYTTGYVEGDKCVGGLVGASVNGSQITSCYSEAEVRGQKDLGGLIGNMDGTLSDSYATGNVYSSLSGDYHNGALCGGSISVSGTGCYSSGKVYDVSMHDLTDYTNPSQVSSVEDIPILAGKYTAEETDYMDLWLLALCGNHPLDRHCIEFSDGTIIDNLDITSMSFGDFTKLLNNSGIIASFVDGKIVIGDPNLHTDENYIAAGGHHYITNMDSALADALGLRIGNGKSYVQENGDVYRIINNNDTSDTVVRSQTGMFLGDNFDESHTINLEYGNNFIELGDGSILNVDSSMDYHSVIGWLQSEGVYVSIQNNQLVIDSAGHDYIKSISEELAAKLGIEAGEGKSYDTPCGTPIKNQTTTATSSTTLNELGYNDITINLKDGSSTNFSNSQTLGDIVQWLNNHTINASLTDGQISVSPVQGSEDNYISGTKYLLNSGVDKVYDNLFGMEIGLNTSHQETIGNSLGITEGRIEYVDDEGNIRACGVITSTTTVKDLQVMFSDIGITMAVDGTQITLSSNENLYLTSEHEGQDGISNIVSALFSNITKTYHTDSATQDYDETITDQIDATLDTLLTTYDTPGSLCQGILAFTLDGQDRFINITENDTIGSLIEKFESKGLDAAFSNNQLIISAGDREFNIDSLNSTSNIMNNINMTFGDDIGVYARSSSAVMADHEVSTVKDISVANYANSDTLLSTVGITAGSFSIYRDGVKKVIQIDSNDTFYDLNLKGSDAFDEDDIRIGVGDGGKLLIESVTEGVKVLAGSSSDTSNILSICGLREGENNNVVGSRALYAVNAQSKITTEGAFRRGTVTEGTFTVGDAAFNITSDTTISGLISQINSSEKSGATAYWDSIDGKLVLTSRVSGASILNIEAGTSNFTDIMGLTINGDRIDRTTQTLGSNAKFTINGTNYTAASNTITSDISRIGGLTINLKNVSNEAFDITVTKDAENLVETIQEFVDSYNELIENVDNEIANANTSFDDKFSLKQIRNQIRNIALSTFSNTGVYSNLTSVGITTQNSMGASVSTTGLDNLYLDKDKFYEKYSQSPDSIKTLLVGDDSTPGILMQIENVVKNALSSGSGYFASAEKSYQRKIENINEKIVKANKAVEVYRNRLENKFKTMDMLIATMQDQYKSFLTQSSST